MGARNGAAIEECEELAESIKEGPVGEQTDTLVGIDRADVRGGIVGDSSRRTGG